MDSIHKFENTIEGWLKPLPHLPVDWRNWLAKNVWWLVLIGVILSVLGTFMLAAALFAAMAAISTVTSFYGVSGINLAPVYTGWWYAASIVSLAFLVLTIIINAMAVSPLKAMKNKGWDLLFLTFVISVISSIVSIIFSFSSYTVVTTIISSVIGIVIGAYLLFEIRSNFKSTAAVK